MSYATTLIHFTDACERSLLPAGVADQTTDAAGVGRQTVAGQGDGQVPGAHRPSRGGGLARVALDGRARQTVGKRENSGQARGQAKKGELETLKRVVAANLGS